MPTRLKLRPHHLLDVIRDIGHQRKLGPHPYNHNVHGVAAIVAAAPDVEIEFVLAADDICAPCIHRQPNGLCDDVLAQLPDRPSKQTYNDALDEKLFAHLAIPRGTAVPLPRFLEIIAAQIPGLENLCTHPGEDKTYRLDGLIKGIERLRRKV